MGTNFEFTFPNILVNSYVDRIETIDTPASTDSDMLFDLSVDWPALIFIKKNSEVDVVHSCPMNMHQIIWGVPDDNESVDIKLFHKDDEKHFEPNFGVHEKYLHYPIFNLTGFEANFTGEKSAVQFIETTLSVNEYVFIPENYLVTLRSGKSKENNGGFNIFR